MAPRPGFVPRFALAFALLGAGCALTSKSDPLDPHYFTPELLPVGGGRVSPRAATAGVRLGRVRAGDELRDRIVFRPTAYEVGYYDDKLWTEKPDVYLRRALARALFEERGVPQAVTSLSPTIDVELLAFEEVRGPHPLARIRLTVVVHDEQAVRLEQTFSVEQPVAPSAPGAPPMDAFVHAMSEALQRAVAQTVDRVLASLDVPQKG